MKITGNRSISSMIKIFLIIIFAICIASIITVPIVIENQGDVNFKQMITFLQAQLDLLATLKKIENEIDQNTKLES